MVVIFRHAKRRASHKNEMVDKKTILHMIISIGGIMFLFGLTWLFAIFMNIGAPYLREAFQVLFTTFNCLQGIFIFFFLCVLSSDARNEWKRFLKCRQMEQVYVHVSPSKSTIDQLVEMSEKSKTNKTKINSHVKSMS